MLIIRSEIAPYTLQLCNCIVNYLGLFLGTVVPRTLLKVSMATPLKSFKNPI